MTAFSRNCESKFGEDDFIYDYYTEYEYNSIRTPPNHPGVPATCQ